MEKIRQLARFVAAFAALWAIACPARVVAQGTCSPFSLTPVSLQSLQLNGTASFAGGALTLVGQSQSSAAGVAWDPAAVPLAGGIAVQFVVNASQGQFSLLPPDGFSVLLQNQSTALLGGASGGLGDAGLLNTLAIEFRTNGTQPTVAITQSSATAPLGSVQPLFSAPLPINLADGNYHTVHITLLPLSGSLTAPPGPSMEVTVELDNTVVAVGGAVADGTFATFPAASSLSAGSAYLGLGASSGANNAAAVNVQQLQLAIGASASSSAAVYSGLVLLNQWLPVPPGFPYLFDISTPLGSVNPPEISIVPNYFQDMIVQALDACGNPSLFAGGDSVQVSITPIGAPPIDSSPIDSSPILEPVDYIGGGRYVFWFMIPAMGNWQLNVAMNGRPIPGSPFNAGSSFVDGLLLAQVAAAANVSNGVTTSSASLTDANGAPLAGEPLQFTLPGGLTLPATTAANGLAQISVPAPTVAGNYTVSVSFAGNGTYTAASNTAAFQIAAADPLTQCDANLAAAQSNIQSLNTQVAELQSQLNAANATITNQSSTIATLQGQLGTANATITSQSSAIATLQGQLGTANATVGTLQGQLTTANATITSQSSAITTLQGQLALANATIASLSSTVAGLQATVAAFENQIASLTQALQVAFSNPSFVVPGATLPQQLQNLVAAIGKLNHGQLQALYRYLGGQ